MSTNRAGASAHHRRVGLLDDYRLGIHPAHLTGSALLTCIVTVSALPSGRRR